jgi:hypothetical protein
MELDGRRHDPAPRLLLALLDISSETDETRRIRVDFPISSVAGAASTSVVYFELEPGEHTGMHAWSASSPAASS